jgi:hypothetical protein
MSVEVAALRESAAQAFDRFGLNIAILITFAGGELDAKEALVRRILKAADYSRWHGALTPPPGAGCRVELGRSPR